MTIYSYRANRDISDFLGIRYLEMPALSDQSMRGITKSDVVSTTPTGPVGYFWVNDGETETYAHPDYVDKLDPKWKKGRLKGKHGGRRGVYSEERTRKRVVSTKKYYETHESKLKGRKLSAEHREVISLSANKPENINLSKDKLKNGPNTRVCCLGCKKNITVVSLKRFHAGCLSVEQ